jgi:inosine/xanthosine triphosphatase
MYFFVGSTNPVKMNAVKVATTAVWPEQLVQGFEVPSGVHAQPFSDDETRQGAENRAKAALTEGLKIFPDVKEALGVGLEGGVFKHGKDEVWSTVWGAVVDQHGQVFVANGMRMKVPDQIAELMLAGQEMGPVMEQLSGVSDVRKNQGMIGIVTNNFVNRTEEYAAIAKLAIGLWYGRNWEKTARAVT